MKVLVVNLGSQWTHRIWRVLRDLECDTQIVPATTPVEALRDADGIVLSGGAVRIGKGEGESTAVKNCASYLKEFSGGVMGICAGQQFIVLQNGGEVKPARKPEYGKVEITVKSKDGLFRGIPKKFTAWASHNDEITRAPGFKLLASSRDCKWHALKHSKRPWFGTLFHPEVEHTQHGARIYENFVHTLKN